MSNPVIPPWRVSAEPTPDEIRSFHVDRLIESLRQEKEAKDVEKAVLTTLRRSDDTYEGGHMAMTYVVDGPNGHPVVSRHYFAKAPPHVRALLAAQPPLVTGLEWTHMAFEARIEFLSTAGLAPDLALSADVREVFQDQTDQHLIAWQKLINDGTAFNVGANVSEQAEELIKAGYLLYAPREIAGAFSVTRSRHDIPPGQAGSPVFVRSIMGEHYLAWIEAVR